MTEKQDDRRHESPMNKIRCSRLVCDMTDYKLGEEDSAAFHDHTLRYERRSRRYGLLRKCLKAVILVFAAVLLTFIANKIFNLARKVISSVYGVYLRWLRRLNRTKKDLRNTKMAGQVNVPQRNRPDP
jgi:hypothetical protein